MKKAVALDFASFLLQFHNEIKRIILFGSVARGDDEEESDIDIFIETEKNSDFSKTLEKYYSSVKYKYWSMLGKEYQISIKSGKLDDYALKRSIISNGILLYGPFIDKPKTKGYALFLVNTGSSNIGIYRKLYGYKQVMNGKIYVSKGIINELEGKKIMKGVFILPLKNSQSMILILKKMKINYRIIEFWSDSIIS